MHTGKSLIQASVSLIQTSVIRIFTYPNFSYPNLHLSKHQLSESSLIQTSLAFGRIAPSLGGCMIVVLVEGGRSFVSMSISTCLLCLCTPVMESYMVVCGWRREGAVSLYGRTMDLVPVCGVPLYLSVWYMYMAVILLLEVIWLRSLYVYGCNSLLIRLCVFGFPLYVYICGHYSFLE